MSFMDALILIFIVRAIVNFFGASKKRSRNQNKKTPYNTQAVPRTPERKNNKVSPPQRQKSGRNLTSILTEIQKEIERIDGKTEKPLEEKKKSYAETVVERDKKSSYDGHVLKPQVLKTERQKEIEELYEGMGGLAEDKISISDMEDYQIALYGDSDEDSLFDYDSMEMDAEWETEEGSIIMEIIDDKSFPMDLKTGIILKEILDKPISIRN